MGVDDIGLVVTWDSGLATISRTRQKFVKIGPASRVNPEKLTVGKGWRSAGSPYKGPDFEGRCRMWDAGIAAGDFVKMRENECLNK